MRCKIVVNLL